MLKEAVFHKTFEVKKDKITNLRQQMIKDFLDEINAERVGTKYKPLTPRAVAVKVGHIKTPDLYPFYQQCKRYKGGFSRAFFGILKA